MKPTGIYWRKKKRLKSLLTDFFDNRKSQLIAKLCAKICLINSLAEYY